MTAPGPVADGWRARVWSGSGAVRWALAPASLVFRAAIGLRRLAYRIGLFRRVRVAVPVISIGNLTVGGTGKTPAALWLAGRLREAGARPAIVTRGYGGALHGRVSTASRGGRGDGGIEMVGDEAVLLAQRFDGPVVCGVDRVAAATAAIESGANVVVLDDGFQHWRLERDFDLVLVDGGAGFGNAALLPAGPLREPLGALARAHAIVVTKTAPSETLASTLARHAPGVPVLTAELLPTALVRVEDGVFTTHPLGAILGRRIVTVSGIGQPRSFYEMLGQLEVRPVEVLEFADHHDYTQADWQRITHAAHSADLVVCTEKDLVKLCRFPFARDRLIAVRVEFQFAEGDEARLLAAVRERLA